MNIQSIVLRLVIRSKFYINGHILYMTAKSISQYTVLLAMIGHHNVLLISSIVLLVSSGYLPMQTCQTGNEMRLSQVSSPQYMVVPTAFKMNLIIIIIISRTVITSSHTSYPASPPFIYSISSSHAICSISSSSPGAAARWWKGDTQPEE